VDEDRPWLDAFYEFERWSHEAAGSAAVSADDTSKWVVRFTMDAAALLDKNITMDDIHFALTNSKFGGDIFCAYSDYNAAELVFRVRMNAASFAKGKRKGGAIDPLDQSDDIYVLKMFQDQLLNNIVLRGIYGIVKVTSRKVQSSVVLDMVTKRDGKYVKKDTWVLDTTGTNLLDVLALDYIDNTRTFSNDIREVFHVLGLEAARQMIYNEMSDVMEFSGGGYINYHHLGLLCDRMTCNFNMIPIFRSGLLSDDTGPLARCTFEEQTVMLLQAARHGDVDPMRGVSANVMCGQFGNFGTSSFQLVLDMEAALEAAHPAEDEAAAAVAEREATVPKSKMMIHTNIKPTMAIDDDDDDDEQEEYNLGF
jgi:DNA-directed RNA polymerase II subunit RPB1